MADVIISILRQPIVFSISFVRYVYTYDRPKKEKDSDDEESSDEDEDEDKGKQQITQKIIGLVHL